MIASPWRPIKRSSFPPSMRRHRLFEQAWTRDTDAGPRYLLYWGSRSETDDDGTRIWIASTWFLTRTPDLTGVIARQHSVRRAMKKPPCRWANDHIDTEDIQPSAAHVEGLAPLVEDLQRQLAREFETKIARATGCDPQHGGLP